MLVTFECTAFANITMFGDVAKQLIKLMGFSGNVPGAMRADDVPAALEKLQAAIKKVRQQESESDEDGAGNDAEPPVSLATRAMPLVQLLQAAAAEEVPVMWRE